ncbi:hypothetical protein ACJQWM_07525 [Lysobacter sp. D1-1-M9]|uniref:HVO_A0114 family putative DNA-binding protein n=1 Tax=Novilysobacter longmucuonensis TaxID=3098603 RepID=UPI002FC7E328
MAASRQTRTAFASWRQLAGVLSDENRALLRLIQEKQSRTVQALAELSGRAASNLSRALRNLEDSPRCRTSCITPSTATQQPS